MFFFYKLDIDKKIVLKGRRISATNNQTNKKNGKQQNTKYFLVARHFIFNQIMSLATNKKNKMPFFYFQSFFIFIFNHLKGCPKVALKMLRFFSITFYFFYFCSFGSQKYVAKHNLTSWQNSSFFRNHSTTYLNN